MYYIVCNINNQHMFIDISIWYYNAKTWQCECCCRHWQPFENI